MTLKSAGAIFNRDHTTVIHGVEKLHDIMDTEPAVKAEVEMLEGFVRG
jgi:chromosomal replication initiation ATPase DnaA